MLSIDQQRELKVRAGQLQPSRVDPAGRLCTWTNYPVQPAEEYTAQLIRHPGVARAAPVAPIAGRTTVDITPQRMNLPSHCVLQVDVEPGTMLWVEWGNATGNYPGITHQLACDKARTAATDMIGNYHPRQG